MNCEMRRWNVKGVMNERFEAGACELSHVAELRWEMPSESLEMRSAFSTLLS